MPMESAFIAFGPHDPALAKRYNIEVHRLEKTPLGAPIANHYHMTATSNGTRELAAALGIDLDDASTWHFPPGQALARLEKLRADEDLVQRLHCGDVLDDLVALNAGGHWLVFELC